MKNYLQFSLAINNETCRFWGYVNDIPAFNNARGNSFDLNVAINHLIQDGVNTVRIHVKPLEKTNAFDEYSDCEASILVKELNERMDQTKVISQNKLSNLYPKQSLSLPEYILPLTFDSKSGFSKFPWSEMMDLKKDKINNFKKIQEEISHFHSLFRSRNAQAIFDRIAPRERYYSQRFFEEFNHSFEKTKEDFLDTINNEEYEIQELDFVNYPPTFFANGHIAAFENMKGEQPLFFLNNKERMRRQYPLYYSIDHSGQIHLVL
jgi:hypothetical protein